MDDAGEMSSWYVFNAMGFYPFSPADTYYLVTVPEFDQVKLKLKNHPAFYIRRKGRGDKIKTLILNGKKLNKLRITHSEIAHGGHLEVEVDR
jgi:putative alpha-1,2-mannosidase